MAHVDFYFDFASPWAFLASTRIERLCADHGATLAWKPIDLPRVRELVERPDAPSPCAAQFANMVADIQRWAQRYGVTVGMPVQAPTHPALCGCYLARDMNAEARYIHRVFQSRWADSEDLADDAVIQAIAADCGMEADTLRRAMAGEDTAERLESTSQEAADRGVFGVPTIFVDAEMFWGNDRLDFVTEALARQ